MSDTETNYVAGLATRWARTDPMEQWVNAAPEGGRTPRNHNERERIEKADDPGQNRQHASEFAEGRGADAGINLRIWAGA